MIKTWQERRPKKHPGMSLQQSAMQDEIDELRAELIRLIQQEPDGPLVEGWQITVTNGHSGYGAYPDEGAIFSNRRCEMIKTYKSRMLKHGMALTLAMQAEIDELRVELAKLTKLITTTHKTGEKQMIKLKLPKETPVVWSDEEYTALLDQYAKLYAKYCDILAELDKIKRQEPIRFWVAGCGTYDSSEAAEEWANETCQPVLPLFLAAGASKP